MKNQISILLKNKNESCQYPNELLNQIKKRTEKFATIIRPLEGLKQEIIIINNQLKNIVNLIKIKKNVEIIDYFRTRDALITQLFFLKAILNYHISCGGSRGSYFILREKLISSLSERYVILPDYLKEYKFIYNDVDLSHKIQTLQWKNGQIIIEWENVREIPTKLEQFENMWRNFMI